MVFDRWIWTADKPCGARQRFCDSRAPSRPITRRLNNQRLGRVNHAEVPWRPSIRPSWFLYRAEADVLPGQTPVGFLRVKAHLPQTQGLTNPVLESHLGRL